MSRVRVSIAKDGDVGAWEGHAALVVVVREDGGQPLPMVSIRGGSAEDLVFGLAYLMAQVEREVHPGALEAAMAVKDKLAALGSRKRVVGAHDDERGS